MQQGQNVAAILQMPNPTDMEVVRRLQGTNKFPQVTTIFIHIAAEPLTNSSRLRMGAATRYFDGRAEETHDVNYTSEGLPSHHVLIWTSSPIHLWSENDCQHRSQTPGNYRQQTAVESNTWIQGMLPAETLSRECLADICEQFSQINAAELLQIG